jgi:hypothetical protein
VWAVEGDIVMGSREVESVSVCRSGRERRRKGRARRRGGERGKTIATPPLALLFTEEGPDELSVLLTCAAQRIERKQVRGKRERERRKKAKGGDATVSLPL